MQRFQRFVGLLLVGLAALGAVLVGVSAAVVFRTPRVDEATSTTVGFWHLLYNTTAPSPVVILGATGLGLLLAAAVALVERRVSTRARRSEDAQRMPLAPKLVMAETRGVDAGPVTITVLIPAHDEAGCIAATIASLRSQSHPPERIIVVADNCSDETVPIARAAGVEVIETVGNTKKKAGGLNQVLTVVLPEQGDNDTVMIMDADTTLDQGFLAAAVRRLTDDRALMAVGGLFYGEDGAGLIGQFQRNEYTRYARDVSRRRGRVFVLTGTASIFRPRALRTVAAERGRAIPGLAGDVYDTLVLTEDNELTLAIKSLGGLMISPSQCTVVTEVMETWAALWAQRLRWQRGAVENLGDYGLRPSVMRYWAQQLGIGYGVIALVGYLLLILVMLLALDQWVWFPFWVGVGGLFMLERVVTVWRGGWRARVLALTLFPELAYSLVLNAVFVKGVLDIAFRRQASWKHVVQSAAPSTSGTPA
ncbi:Glycosyltransferase, catalytic subunit of cellulose synthase and poly-beta-1,6-N-acetylglucosamine synthase [Friedmanniella luteola]|uniref:Glycosyltransferase, catalytic subunit of cellulose synthase and poly-beta-1,6-N-acetylglucosamine synthase n=1 Tax=Friedmanniella luteola TaxID=546871 RepID=A0A1H2A860_9ACTN|nr:glycosyltransferase family 2 protein [Friedmanniella luteola]SDT42057.1 Glycosyltransferase, catalytic subunit of cellulose synthase and poly-beta-1,6-N-acetylglucosamine synthase [Friedmanniella luteola]